MDTNQKIIDRVRAMPFSTVYPLYVKKVERKGQVKTDLDAVIRWLTGYSDSELASSVNSGMSCGEFFDNAIIHPNSQLITGKICGVQVELIEDPFMKRVRQLDKIVDEIANGRAIEKVLRA